MSDELKIGVIGAGGRGLLAGHVHEIDGGGARLVAGADVNDAALDHFKERFGEDVMVTHDYRDILARDDIAAVFVSTPDFLHEEHAVAALQAGKHVYLEKPMAITIEGCDRILRAAMEAGVKLYVGHNMRHMTVIQKMKELVDAGEIGEVKTGWCRHFCGYGGDAYFKDWHAEREKSTSLLLQKGTHDIDVLHWICGGYSKRVTAMGNLTVYNQIEDRREPDEPPDISWTMENWPPLSQKGMNPIIDVEDLSMMLMELDNGVLCSYQQCHYSPDGWRNYTIIGTEGRIENFGDAPGATTIKLWNKRCHYGPNKAIDHEIPDAEGSHGGADPEIVKEFVEFIRDDGPISVSAIASRNSVAAGCMAAESLRNGSTPRDIPPVADDLLEYFSKLGH
jgi:predicted dehydrogenase